MRGEDSSTSLEESRLGLATDVISVVSSIDAAIPVPVGHYLLVLLMKIKASKSQYIGDLEVLIVEIKQNLILYCEVST